MHACVFVCPHSKGHLVNKRFDCHGLLELSFKSLFYVIFLIYFHNTLNYIIFKPFDIDKEIITVAFSLCLLNFKFSIFLCLKWQLIKMTDSPPGAKRWQMS